MEYPRSLRDEFELFLDNGLPQQDSQRNSDRFQEPPLHVKRQIIGTVYFDSETGALIEDKTRPRIDQ